MAEIHKVSTSDDHNPNLISQKISNRKQSLHIKEMTFEKIRKRRETCKNVNLDLNIDDIPFKQVIKVLRSMRTIEKIDVIKSKYEPSETKTKAVCLAIRKLSTIRSLCFRYKNNDSSDSSLEQIAQCVKACKISKKIELSLSGQTNLSLKTVATDKGLMALSKAMKSLPFIERVKLDFLGFNNITGKGFESLCTSLKRCQKLQEIGLNIPRCGRVDVENPSAIQSALKRIVSLRSLSMNLMGTKLSDEFFKSLIVILKGFSLQKLQPDLKECSRITDNTVRDLAESLKGLSLLKRIDLNFQKTQITNKTIGYLGKILQNLISLQEIWMDFRMCQQVTNDVVKTFKGGEINLSETCCSDLSYRLKF